MVRTRHFHCRGPGFDPCSDLDPASCMARPKKKKKKKQYISTCQTLRVFALLSGISGLNLVLYYANFMFKVIMLSME